MSRGGKTDLVLSAAISVLALSAVFGSVTARPVPSTSTARVADAERLAASTADSADVLARLSGQPPSAAAPTAAATPAALDPVAELAQRRNRAGQSEVRSVTIAVTGDILLHEPVMAAAATPSGGYDFRPMLAPIATEISAADIALCHLEVPLSRDGSGLSGYPTFNAPPEIADAIAATGYHGCSTASNHSLDQRPAGIAATLDALDSAGLGHAGTARSLDEDAAPRLYRAGGLVIGHVSATYGLNGFVMPDDQPWLVDLIDPVSGVLAEAAATRAAGADIVVVSVHWGEEYQTEPSPYQRAVADQLLASPDVDLLVGHHAHVVQPVERVGDKAVIFGLGNLLSGQLGRHTAGTQDGVIVTVTLADSPNTTPRVPGIRYMPTWVEPGTYRVLPIPETVADPALPADRRRALEASAARTAAAIGPVGR